MLIAQASSPALPTVTHVNGLFHEWGLLAALCGASVPLLGALWWLMEMKTDETTAALLRIRSMLAGLFQATVVQEALRLFDLVDEHLSISLSQLESTEPRLSAFDRLAQGLAQIDPNEQDRADYLLIIEHALSGVITREVRKLLQLGDATTSGALDRLRNPTGMTFGFEEHTERTLTIIATKTAHANRKEKWLGRHKSWAFYGFLISTIAIFLCLPFFFFDTSWAYHGLRIALAVLAIGAAFGVLSIGLLHSCKAWIFTTAAGFKELNIVAPDNE